MTTRRRTLVLTEARRAIDALRLLHPDDDAAIREGRCFVERRRISDKNELLTAGCTLTLHTSRKPTDDGTPLDVPRVLGQREGVLAVYKPAAWSSEPDQTGTALCLSTHLKEQRSLREVHIATRLDVGVSGLVLVATQAEARRHLTQLVTAGTLHRVYLALAVGQVVGRGQWTGAVENKPQNKAREAITNYERLATVSLPAGSHLGSGATEELVSLLCFRPQTGRRHQLRIHAARHGHPLLGDRRYGGPRQLIREDGRIVPLSRILLQAVSTELPLPSGERWSIHCPVDEEVGGFWRLLGGNDADFRQ